MLRALILVLLACGLTVGACRRSPSAATALSRHLSDSSRARATRSGAALPPVADRPQAPELDGGIAWLNTSRPLRMSDLRGQVTVVDFWTYCCINCLHTLPALAELEARHRRDPVAVLGVHSAKFPGEREADRIAEAIERYGVHHPVVVDSDSAIWNRWGVHAWPTVFVIDTHGRIVAVTSGEPSVNDLDVVITALLEEARADGSLAARPIAVGRAPRPSADALAYPGKVVALDGTRIAFSDSGHDRIVVARLDGSVEHVVGQGIPGSDDGDFEHARFHRPQGLAFEPAPPGQTVRVLYVADTENHLVRRVDLAALEVSTIAGTGALGRSAAGTSVRDPARSVALRSPWDLSRTVDGLVVAMAGAHQLWLLDLTDGTIGAWAGSGREARIDGVGMAAAFAQPSGLALDGDTLYVADSETSSIRAVDRRTRRVRTLVGEDLFVFGDVDGDVQRARLQHPLGVAVSPAERGTVYVVDTYNHKVKALDLAARTVRTVVGNARREPLFEPSGMAWSGSEAIVADTNHHRLLRVSRNGQTAVPIVFWSLTAPVPQVADAPAPDVAMSRASDPSVR